MPMARAAQRSSDTAFVNSPQSLTRTETLRPVLELPTRRQCRKAGHSGCWTGATRGPLLGMLTARGLGMSASPSIVLQNSATARVGSLWGMSEHGALLALPPLRGIGGRYTIFDASLSSAGWNYFIEMECLEELPLTRCQPTHHSLPPTLIVSAPPNHASRPPSMAFCNTIPSRADMLRADINVCKDSGHCSNASRRPGCREPDRFTEKLASHDLALAHVSPA